jgi:hypothetical protein
LNTFKSLLACGLLSLAVAAPAAWAAAKTAPAKPAATAKPSAPAPSAAASAPASKPLDQDAVKRFYNDGDFPPAINLLEDFQHSRSRFARDESVMVYKYLGVMYSADQSTREKGKSYFYKLLAIDPQAKILDMYVSIVVQDIFKSTLDELMGNMPIREGEGDSKSALASSQTTNASGSPGASGPAGSGGAKVEERKSHRLYWWLGGIGLAAGIAGGYYAYSALSEKKAEDTDIPVP